MPTLTVHTEDSTRELSYSPGASLREIVEAAGMPIRSGCRGNGACGLCLVRISSGTVHGLTKNETLQLSTEEIGRGIRLACQVTPDGDLSIHLFAPIKPTPWRDSTHDDGSGTASHARASADRGSTEAALGLAVDLGTTHIHLSVWNLGEERKLCGLVGPNPQCRFGTDVVTRIMAAQDAPENARTLARMPRDAIREALQDARALVGYDSRDIRRILIVGNTAMLALLTQSNPQKLLEPRHWAAPFDCNSESLSSWPDVLGIHPDAAVEIVSPFAGFVGSDLLAGVLSTKLIDRPGSMLIDFGTNSEMALWDGATLWVTSAAGGPAFEGSELQCGMLAEPGAIYRFERRNDSAEMSFKVIGTDRAQGICGSGIVDLVALLRASGELTSVGKFASPRHQSEGYPVQGTAPTLRLKAMDVDMLQRAKAAIGAGIELLLQAAHLNASHVHRVCVGGAFGRHLNIENARSIGLLPAIAVDRVELSGNTALAGCERLLLSPAVSSRELALLRRKAAIINIAQATEFESIFMENLFLQPLRADKS